MLFIKIKEKRQKWKYLEDWSQYIMASPMLAGWQSQLQSFWCRGLPGLERQQQTLAPKTVLKKCVTCTCFFCQVYKNDADLFYFLFLEKHLALALSLQRWSPPYIWKKDSLDVSNSSSHLLYIRLIVWRQTYPVPSEWPHRQTKAPPVRIFTHWYR